MTPRAAEIKSSEQEAVRISHGDKSSTRFIESFFEAKTLAIGRDPYLVSALFGVSLQSFAEAQGLDFVKACKELSIKPDKLQSMIERLTCEQLATLLERLAHEANDTAFSMKYAQSCVMGDFGPLLYYVQKLPNLEKAITESLRFMPMVIDLPKLEFSVADGIGKVAWAYSPYISNIQQFNDLMAVIIDRIFVPKLLSRTHLIRVNSTRHKPPHHALLDAFLENKYHYDQNEIAIYFKQEALTVPNLEADSSLALLMKIQCEALFKLLKMSRSNFIVARQKILELLQFEDPTVDRVAELLGVSVRTLQRQLQKQGSSFSDILDDTRRDYSTHLLSNANMSIEDIAFKVGYKAVSVYSRAAKEWYGISPSQYRKKIPEINM